MSAAKLLWVTEKRLRLARDRFERTRARSTVSLVELAECRREVEYLTRERAFLAGEVMS